MSDESKFSIEKGIPLPTDRWSTRSKWISILREMEVGDSVLLPIKRNGVGQLCERAWGKKSYVSRQENGQRRIWRIK